MSWHFHKLFIKKLQNAPHSVEKHEKSSIWPKLCNFFEQSTMSLHFDQLFGKKLPKVLRFVKKHEKSSIWRKLATLPGKLPCFGVLVNFSAKSGSFREAERNIIHLAKSCNFSSKLVCFRVLVNFSAKGGKSGSFGEK